MKQIKLSKCPYCDGTVFVKGYRSDGIYSTELMGTPQTSGMIEYTICKDCGSVVHMRVVPKGKFMKRKLEE